MRHHIRTKLKRGPPSEGILQQSSKTAAMRAGLLTPPSLTRKRTRPVTWLLRVVLFGSFALVTACSGTRLLYDNLDWLLYRGLDQRFDISAQQRPWVKDRLRALHRWHRETQMPRYAESLRELARRYVDGFGLHDFHWLDGEIEAYRRVLVARIIPDFSDFLAALEAEQIDHFAKFAATSLEEAAEPLELGFEDRLDHRFGAFTEQLTRWTGDLDHIQAAALRRALAKWPDFRRDWVEQRRIRQQSFLTMLRADPPPSVIEGYLSAHWLDLRASYPPPYWASRQAAKSRLLQVLWDTEKRLSPPQRAHVLERIERYADDIHRLTQQT